VKGSIKCSSSNNRGENQREVSGWIETMSSQNAADDRRIEPEQLAGVSAPESDENVVDVDGHGIDEEGEVTTEGVMEAVESLANNDDN